MLRRIALTAVALALAACSNCDQPCKEGITFFVGDVAGALSSGSDVPLNICFDGECKDVTITRDHVGGSVFLEFKGVGKEGDHQLTVTSTSSLQGQYSGPVYSYRQDPGGSCSACDLATVKIGADGTLTPALPAPSESTTVATPGSASG